MPNANYVHTITLYNCLHARDNPDKRDSWQRSVLHNCFYKTAIGRVEAGTTVSMASTYTVRIPESAQYLPYHEWCKRSEEERQNYFTVHVDDLVVYGECSEEITGKTHGTAVELLNKRKPEAFVIKAFSDNTSFPRSKHYRLGG